VPTTHLSIPWRSAAIAVLGASLALAGGASAASAAGSGGATASATANGSSVAAIQRALGVKADGIYGPRTRRAVRAFQRKHGLVADGIAGPQTLRALGLTATASARRVTSASSSLLRRIALCESGGNPRAVSADGRYRGKYQFSRATWRALGGSGDPARAPGSVQDAMAAKLLAARGTSPWPNCT
jgi:Transglycosylase-like domain/Putative peptidoglycan binding domain